VKTTLTLLVASTALTAAIGLPAWSATQSLATADARPVSAVLGAATAAPAVILASNDDDDYDEGDRRRSKRGHEDDDDDECDDNDCAATTANPAPAGTVAPPKNGLFGNGAPPQVQVK